jgi:hypothetical protein
MKWPQRPLLTDIRAGFGTLGDDLRETAAARWELARLELEADLRLAKRLAIAWSVTAAMALTALPLLAICLAEVLDGQYDISRQGWLLILAGVLLIAGLGGAWLAWRRFRRRFTGLDETLEELREDLAWLSEKVETLNAER